MKHYSAVAPVCFVPLDDLAIARRAAAEANAEQGYPALARGYLDGEWDNDTEVQSALIAVRLARQIDSINPQSTRSSEGGNTPLMNHGDQA